MHDLQELELFELGEPVLVGGDLEDQPRSLHRREVLGELHVV